MITGTVEDLVANFLYYDRKGDEELKVGDIEEAIENNVITIDEIVQHFRSELEKHL